MLKPVEARKLHEPDQNISVISMSQCLVHTIFKSSTIGGIETPQVESGEATALTPSIYICA